MNVRDTANIDVVNRPSSRMEHQPKESNNQTGPLEASRPPAYSTAIQRDFTVGTLKRGRKVIRLQTTRLPSPDSIAKPKQEEPKPKEVKVEPKRAVAIPKPAPLAICEEQEEASTRVKSKPAIRAYGGAERMPLPVTPASPVARCKMTPGEKMKEKYMVFSRKGPKKATILHQRLPAPSPAVPIAASVLPPVAVTTLSKDSGLGSSPVITAPTSFRDPKLADKDSKSNKPESGCCCYLL